MVKGQLAGLGRVSVEGEVSEVKRAASGHVYFSLKDSSARVPCVAWRSTVQRLKLELRVGDQVVVHGKIDVYEPRGSYNLTVDGVERQGLGALLAQLEKLKGELKAKGWFDRKRPLPSLPRMIGVVTSRDTAAWQDFQKTQAARWPDFPLRLAHAPVQGRGSAVRLAQAIDRLAQSGVDVICVIRGGGSLEDLWAFNELPVAEAVFRSPVPVVSGVGHETDTTLIDLVADHRAHTPTDAATVAIPERQALFDRVERADEHLSRAFFQQLEDRVAALEQLASRPVLRDGQNILKGPAERLAHLQAELLRGAEQVLGTQGARLAKVATGLAHCAPARRVQEGHTRLAALAPRLGAAATQILTGRGQRLELIAQGLGTLSPLAVLERGYSITRDASGRALRRGSEVQPGQVVETILGEGSLRSTVDSSEAKRGGEGI